MKRAFSIFMLSAGGLLLAMGIVTLFGAYQGTQRLAFPDPLLGITIKNLMVMTGSFELVVAILCLWQRFMKTQVVCVLWVAGNLGVYQLVLINETGRSSAACLANWTGPLQIHAAAADTIMATAICYLILSGCLAGLCVWRQDVYEKQINYSEQGL